jgi:predicted CopG family antitoxin
MPRKGYVSVTISDEDYEKLVKLKESLHAKSCSSLVSLLIARAGKILKGVRP